MQNEQKGWASDGRYVDSPAVLDARRGLTLPTRRQVFLPNVPDTFRGRVQLADHDPLGAGYAVVSDGERFILLRATAALRASLGKAVTVTRDTKGRLFVRPTPDKDIGV